MRNLGRTTLLASSSREISSGTLCSPPSLGSGSTRKTPHRGVLLAQDDTRIGAESVFSAFYPLRRLRRHLSQRASKKKTPRCGVFSKRSPRHKELKERATPRRATTMWQDREASVAAAFATHDSGVNDVAKTEQKRSRRGSLPRRGKGDRLRWMRRPARKSEEVEKSLFAFFPPSLPLRSLYITPHPSRFARHLPPPGKATVILPQLLTVAKVE